MNRFDKRREHERLMLLKRGLTIKLWEIYGKEFHDYPPSHKSTWRINFDYDTMKSMKEVVVRLRRLKKPGLGNDILEPIPRVFI